MPAEWEPHTATWLSWPHKRESWPEKFEPIPGVFVEIVRALSGSESVHVNVNDAAMQAEVEALLAARGVPLDAVRFFRIPTDDAWCRDHGPIFVVRAARGAPRIGVVDWGYNAWGGKYPPYERDDQVPRRVAEALGLERFAPGVILEGGSIDVNGQGALLTTEACLLHPNRNPHLTRREIERALSDFLGVTRILWLGEGIAGDDTDGHVDDLARFVDPRTVVAAIEEDPAEENYRPLQDNLERLRSMRDAADRPLEVVRLPMPVPAYFQGQRLPASYANFYVANSVVLVPLYDTENDPVALETIRRLFPTRRVVGLDCKDLVWGLGAVHCVTQQQPAV
jgi:agmatine deiminase